MVEKAIRRPSTGKVYYQISEVAQLTGVNESTLRNWEEQHEELRNVRRINNRRHYTATDIANIEQIREKRANKNIKIESPEPETKNVKQSMLVRESVTPSGHEILTPEQVNEIVIELGVVREELRKIASELD